MVSGRAVLIRRTAVRLLGALVLVGLAQVAVPSTSSAVGVSDGGRLLFVRSNQIFTSTTTGASVRQLTTTLKNYRPRWSRDGLRIAYVHEAATGARDLWVMNANGTGKAQVTHLGDVTQPAWSPTGAWLAFGASGHTTSPASVGGPLKKVRATAPFGSPVTLPMVGLPAELDGDEGAEELDPTVGTSLDWSPDGKRIVFDSYFSTDPAMSDAGWWTVVYDVATTGTRVVSGGCTGDASAGCAGSVHDPSWSHGSTYVVQTQKIDYFDNEGDHPTTPNLAYASVVSTAPAAFPDVAGDSDPEFSPSGTKMVFRHGTAVWTANADGSARKQITAGYNPAWQPLP